jgi:hypothetical protein
MFDLLIFYTRAYIDKLDQIAGLLLRVHLLDQEIDGWLIFLLSWVDVAHHSGDFFLAIGVKELIHSFKVFVIFFTLASEQVSRDFLFSDQS